MAIIALILAVAGGICWIMASRGMAGLLLASAAVLWLMPGFDGSGGTGPSGFAAAARPAAAPSGGFKGANGSRHTLEDFRGQVVLLNIWATWCGPCRAEMPSLDRLQAMHGADGLQVLAVSVDREGDQVRRFYQKSGIRNLKVYIDSERGTQSAFRARAIPTTVLIDRDGNVVGSMVGATQWDSPEAQALVRRYLDN
jgi:thiol-disulfide isomerase/thioredoxin